MEVFQSEALNLQLPKVHGECAQPEFAVVVADAADAPHTAAVLTTADFASPPRLGPLQLSRRSLRSLNTAQGQAAPIPVVGISLDGILDFIAHCRSATPSPPSPTDIKYGAVEGVTFGLDECSTEVVKRQWMLSATALPAQQSYCDLLKARGSPHVGKPTVFVSHAWRYRFLDVVAALENWLAKGEAEGGQTDGHGLVTPDAFLGALLQKTSFSSGSSGSSTPRAGSASSTPRAGGQSPRDTSLSMSPKNPLLSMLRRTKEGAAASAMRDEEREKTPLAGDREAAAGDVTTGTLSPEPPKTLRERTFFWFDIFSNSQHNVADKPFKWWTDVFQTNVHDIGHTLLVLEWENPIPLSRAWCIWEVYCTLDKKAAGGEGAPTRPGPAARPAARLEIIMSAKEEATFNTALVDRFETVVKKVSNIDVARADASVEDDKKNIFGAISKTIGVNEVTRLVVAEMRSWVADAGRRQLLKVASDRRALLCGPLVLKYSRLLSDLGRHESAMGLAKEALKGRAELLTGGDANVQLLDAVDHLAYLTFYRGYMSGDQSEMPAAQHLFERAIRGRRRVLADLEQASDASARANASAPDLTLMPVQTLTLAPAQAATEQVLEQRRALLTSLTFGGFCNFSGRSGNRALAISLINEAWEGWIADPVGDSQLSKHYCAWARTELLVFEPHHLCDALQTSSYPAFLQLQRLQGTLHPDTLNMLRVCSQGVFLTSDFSVAVPTVRDSVQLLTRVLGSEHPFTRIAKGNMSLYVSSLGFLGEAEVVGLESITLIQTIEGGPVSWTTVLAYLNAGVALLVKNDDNSSAIYREIKWQVVAAVFYLLDFSILVEIGRFFVTGVFWPSSTRSKLALPVMAGLAFYALVELVMLPFVLLYTFAAVKNAEQAVRLATASYAFCVALAFLLSLPLQTALMLVEWPARALLGLVASSDGAAEETRELRHAAPNMLAALRVAVDRRRPEHVIDPVDLARAESLLEEGEAAAAAALAKIADTLHAKAMELDDCSAVRRALKVPLAVLEDAIAHIATLERKDRHRAAALFSAPVVAEACRALSFCRWQSTLADVLSAVDALPALAKVLSAYANVRVVRVHACSALRNAAQASIASKDALVVGGAVPALGLALAGALADADGDPESCVHALFALAGITAFNFNGHGAVRGLLPLFTRAIERHVDGGTVLLVHDLLQATKVTCFGVFENIREHRAAGLAKVVVRVLTRADFARGGAIAVAKLVVRNAVALLYELAHESDAGRDACIAAGAADVAARLVRICGRDSHFGFPLELLNELAIGSVARAEAVAAARRAAALCG